MDTTTKINELLRLAALGFNLIPLHNPVGEGCSCGKPDCHSRGKEPRISWKESNTSNEDKIKEWNNKWPEANWGAATGTVSGFVVLDVDGEDGKNSLAALMSAHGELPKTLTSKTGKGFHYLFKAPVTELPNRTRMEPGLDIRADGGYIVIPPSIHANGKRYEWIDVDAEIADLPAWLETKIRDKNKKCEPTKHAIRTAAEPAGLSGFTQVASSTRSSIITGQRNSRLHAEAGKLRSMGYTPHQILPLILQINQSECSPPLDESEVVALVESTWRYDPDEHRNIHHTDAGNAELMARKYKGEVLYCPDTKSFLVYDGSRYVKDTENKVEWLMKDLLKSWMIQANLDTDEDRRKRTIQHILKSENQNRIKAAVDSLKSEPGLSAGLDNFDKDIWKFNVANGTIALKTGKLQSHTPADLLMKKSPVKYEPNAKCPHWINFVDSITNGNKELQGFLQEALGYSLTGDTSEQCLFILHGSGANGKSTFIEIAREVLGDYGMQIPVETLLVRKHEGASNDVAGLKGARFAAASEAEKGQSLAESKIKQLVAGNDKISARFLYGEFFDYVPQFKIFLATNWMPKISGTDHGIWRRIRLIPFEVAFIDPKIHPETPTNRQQDRGLGAKLRSELSGILNWMLAGCLRWQKEGLSRPEAVTSATEGYREDNDPVGQFIGERCETDGSEAFAPLYEAYYDWATEARDRPINRKEFSQRLAAKGYNRERRGKSGERTIVGLTLIRVTGLGRVETKPTRTPEMKAAMATL